MKSFLTHVCEKRKFAMAILHWKEELLCDKDRYQKSDMNNAVTAWKDVERVDCVKTNKMFGLNTAIPTPYCHIVEGYCDLNLIIVRDHCLDRSCASKIDLSNMTHYPSPDARKK